MKYLNYFKTFENVDQAKSILKSLDLDITDKPYLEIREILKNHNGYVGWFTKLFYEKKYKIEDLYELFDFIKNNSIYISKLQTNIIEYDDIEKLQDEIEKIKSESDLRKVYNEFPNTQKAFLNIKSDKNLLAILAKRKDIKSFFRKVSSYHNRKDLITALDIFLKTDPSATLDKIESIAINSGSRITHKSYEDNILIVQVFTCAELNKIAGDCSWCIRNEGTFKSYVNSGSKQYIIFLFDKIDNMSRIGYTMRVTSNNFYYTAHNKSDGSVSHTELKDILSEYNFDIKKLNFTLSDIDINATSVKMLIDTFELSKEEIVKLKHIFRANDLDQFTKDEINKFQLLEKTPITIKTLSQYTLPEIISKKLLYRLEEVRASSFVVIYAKYGIEIIEYLKKNTDIILPIDMINRDDKFTITNIVGLYKLQVGNKVGERYGDFRYDFYKTMFKILWFSKEIKELIDKEGKSTYKDSDKLYNKGVVNLVETIDDPDYATVRFFMEEIKLTPTELIEVITLKNCNKKSTYYENILEYCKNNKINTEDIRKDYFKMVTNYTIEDYYLPKYARIFNTEEYEQILSVQIKQKFRGDLYYFKPYNNKSNSTDSSNFYEKWNKHIQSMKLLDVNRYGDDDYIINLILIYMRCGHLNELDHIITKFQSYSGQSIIKQLNEMMTGTFRTNSGLKEPFSEEQCEYLYNWLISKDLSNLTLSRYHHRESPDGVYEIIEGDPRSHYCSSMYLYDRNSFDEYLTYYISNLKYNSRKDDGFSMTGKLPEPGNKEMYTTNRIAELSIMFEFFRDSSKIEKYEYVDFVRELLSWNLSILELKYALSYNRVKDKDVQELLFKELEKKATPKSVANLRREIYNYNRDRW